MLLTNGNYKLNDDRTLTDIKFVHDRLKDSYWAEGRALEHVKRSVANSICFNIMHHDAQIGFARVISDFCTTTYLMDFILHPSFQNRGVGSWALRRIVEDERFQSTGFLLVTKDAMPFYKHCGFKDHPFTCMTLTREKPQNGN